MARIRGPVCRLCRREGMKLFLKGDRCFSEKCAVEKRRFAPGQHGKRRTKVQGYGIQLREKQKVKRIYGMLEKQFRLAYQKAVRSRGVTGEVLLQLLERRLDNVVLKLGFASSRYQARQIISHGHLRVNERKVDVPSFLVKPGDVISLKDRIRKNTFLLAAVDHTRARGIPDWLSLDADHLKGTVVALPARDSITLPIQEQMIIELYSK
ncbi:MAG TPA: 30S ribosomal protein S4 [Candidatus Polarisedimenticolia bacterium]|nr:30S ribosomal protein S4 [Candidatus Polarisedimenticolia bacterium]